MRISDWSSDVCSSDLAEEQLGIVDQPVPAVEKDDGEDLALQARQLVAEEVARNRRIRERRATMHALVDHGPRGLEDLVRGRRLVATTPVANKQRRIEGRRRHERAPVPGGMRSEEHTSELQSLMRLSYDVC